MHSSAGSSDLTYDIDYSCPFPCLSPSSATFPDSSGESPFLLLTTTFFSPSHESPSILRGSSCPCPKEVHKASELATVIPYFSGPMAHQPVRPYYCKGETRSTARDWQPMGCLQLLRCCLGLNFCFNRWLRPSCLS